MAADASRDKQYRQLQEMSTKLSVIKEAAFGDMDKAFMEDYSWLEQTFLTTRKRLRVGEASFGVEEESPKSRARKDVAEGVLSPRDTNAAQTAFSSGKKKAAAPIVSKVAEENSPPPQDDQPSAPSSDFTQPLIDAARSAVDKLSFRAMQKDLKARQLPATGKTDVVRERLFSAMVEEILLRQPVPVPVPAATTAASAEKGSRAPDPRILSPMHTVPVAISAGASAANVKTPSAKDESDVPAEFLSGGKKKGNVFGKLLSGGKKMLKTKMTPAKSATKQAKAKSAAKSATRSRGSVAASASDVTATSPPVLPSPSSSVLQPNSAVVVDAATSTPSDGNGNDVAVVVVETSPAELGAISTLERDASVGDTKSKYDQAGAEDEGALKAMEDEEVLVEADQVEISLTKSPLEVHSAVDSSPAKVGDVKAPSNSSKDRPIPSSMTDSVPPISASSSSSSSSSLGALSAASATDGDVLAEVQANSTKTGSVDQDAKAAVAMETSVFMSPGSDIEASSPCKASTSESKMGEVKAPALPPPVESSMGSSGSSAASKEEPVKPSNLASGVFSFSQLDPAASSASSSSSSSTGLSATAVTKSKVPAVLKSTAPKAAGVSKGPSHALKLEQIRAQQKADREAKEKERQDKAVEREKRALEMKDKLEKEKLAKQQALKEQAKKTLNVYHGGGGSSAEPPSKTSSSVKTSGSKVEANSSAIKASSDSSSSASAPQKPVSSAVSSSSSSSSSSTMKSSSSAMKSSSSAMNSSNIAAGLQKTAEEEAERRAKQAAAQAAADEYDSYCMSEPEEQEADYSDEEENSKPAKRVPAWAAKENLRAALRNQAELKIDPDGIFFECNTCSLEDIFQRSSTRYHKRTSSANWNDDKLSIYDKLVYKRSVGLQDV